MIKFARPRLIVDKFEMTEANFIRNELAEYKLYRGNSNDPEWDISYLDLYTSYDAKSLMRVAMVNISNEEHDELKDKNEIDVKEWLLSNINRIIPI